MADETPSDPPCLWSGSVRSDRWLPEHARHAPGFVAGDLIGVLGGVILLLLVGLQLYSAYLLLAGGGPATFETRAIDLYANSIAVFVAMGLLPFLWIATTRRGGWPGTVDYFRLRGPGAGILKGVGVGILMVLMIVVLGLIIQSLGLGTDNDAIEQIQKVLTWPLILTISLAAGIGEEFLFRGIVQKHIGLWPQAALFGLLHAYQGIYGILLTFLVAIVFGWIIHRGGSLWIPIAGHFTFNFVQLIALHLAPETL